MADGRRVFQSAWMRRGALLLLLLQWLPVVAGSAAEPSPSAPGADRRSPLKSELQRRFGEVWAKTELYFGLSRREGGFISETEWRNFSETVISPALREGFTVLGGEGQYMLRNSPIVIKEQAKVLVVVHPLDQRFDQALDGIIEAYRRRFSQESVLKVTTFVRARF